MVFSHIHRVFEVGDWGKIDTRLSREDAPVFGPRTQKQRQEFYEPISDQGLKRDPGE